MRNQSAWNMYIFRDGRSTTAAAELLNDLISSLGRLREMASETALLDALLRAGELESALADVNSPSAAPISKLTEQLAAALVKSEVDWEESLRLGPDVTGPLRELQLPETLTISPPEGFAYYALHPMSYVDLLRESALVGGSAAVMGIRSIGTTLSAVVQAGLESMGVRAERITVRPTGHPYDRVTCLNDEQKSWIEKQSARESAFFVVDEGPGMSGSSFLSVGDALMGAGVERERITFLCSRVAYAPSLTARDAATRWPAYRSLVVAPNRRLPSGADDYTAGGIWRKRAFGDETHWPESWTQMERLKFVSGDERRLLKFEGYGRFGAEVRARAQAVAEAGFGVAPVAVEKGFSIYPIVEGELLQKAGLTAEVLTLLARYCAFRSDAFRLESASTKDLQTMLEFNFREEFELSTSLRLEVVRPVIADGRMLPHKWMRTNEGALIKFDNASHGDDHFFPGPVDIAWDLAGAIVEWDMDEDARETLLRSYAEASGEDAAARLPAYLMAYGVFRMGYCKMAAEAMRGSTEEGRLTSSYLRYRKFVSNLHGAELKSNVVQLVAGENQVAVLPLKQLA